MRPYFVYFSFSLSVFFHLDPLRRDASTTSGSNPVFGIPLSQCVESSPAVTMTPGSISMGPAAAAAAYRKRSTASHQEIIPANQMTASIGGHQSDDGILSPTSAAGAASASSGRRSESRTSIGSLAEVLKSGERVSHSKKKKHWNTCNTCLRLLDVFPFALCGLLRVPEPVRLPSPLVRGPFPGLRPGCPLLRLLLLRPGQGSGRGPWHYLPQRPPHRHDVYQAFRAIRPQNRRNIQG